MRMLSRTATTRPWACFTVGLRVIVAESSWVRVPSERPGSRNMDAFCWGWFVGGRIIRKGPAARSFVLGRKTMSAAIPHPLPALRRHTQGRAFAISTGRMAWADMREGNGAVRLCKVVRAAKSGGPLRPGGTPGVSERWDVREASVDAVGGGGKPRLRRLSRRGFLFQLVATSRMPRSYFGVGFGGKGCRGQVGWK